MDFTYKNDIDFYHNEEKQFTSICFSICIVLCFQSLIKSTFIYHVYK